MTDMHDEPFDDQLPDDLRVLFDDFRVRYGNTAAPSPEPGVLRFFEVGMTDESHDLAELANNTNHRKVVTVELSNWRTGFLQGRRQLMTTITALIATTAGKLVLGATITATAVGAGQIAGVIDIPGLPTRDPNIEIKTIAAGPPLIADCGSAESYDDEVEHCDDKPPVQTEPTSMRHQQPDTSNEPESKIDDQDVDDDHDVDDCEPHGDPSHDASEADSDSDDEDSESDEAEDSESDDDSDGDEVDDESGAGASDDTSQGCSRSELS